VNTFIKAYGWKRLILNVLAILAMTYELGTPGHTLTEAISIVVYLAVLIEASTHVWMTPQKGTT